MPTSAPLDETICSWKSVASSRLCDLVFRGYLEISIQIESTLISVVSLLRSTLSSQSRVNWALGGCGW